MEINDFIQLSIVELAAKTGISRSTWQRCLSGKLPKEDTLAQIASKLDMSVEDLLKAIHQRIKIKKIKENLYFIDKNIIL